MNFRRPLAIVLSLLIGAQPVVAAAARNAPVPRRTASLQPVLNLLDAGGYQDKATEQALEAAMSAIIASMPAESVQQLREIAELVTSNPTDEATLQQAREKFEQTIAELPPETQELIQKFVDGALYFAGLSFVTAAIFKFQQHKDNPQQIPVGTPIALVFIAAALLFLPSILHPGTGSDAAVTDCAAACVCPAP